MTDSTAEGPIRVLRAQGYPGFIAGIRQPSLIVDVRGGGIDSAAIAGLSATISDSCPQWTAPPGRESEPGSLSNSLEWLLAAWGSLQIALGLPIHEPGHILVDGGHTVRCLMPCAENAQRALVGVIQSSLAVLASPGLGTSIGADDRLRRAIAALGKCGFDSSNAPRFNQAAWELGIPVHELPGRVQQYGVGRNARWLDSSFSDQTSTISTKLARNKVWASALLRRAGLPVPRQVQVLGQQQALRAARQIGYPVVVKPADKDGGVGVAAGLQNEQEVRAAIAAARRHSSNIVLEQHVEGRDYRLTVFNGELIWAVERVPGGVTGDGKRSVSELLALLNADPRRASSQHAPLKKLIWDEEARNLIARQTLTLDAVPSPGQFVRLRRAANVASGGTPVGVFDAVHPDNARLAVRAAEALRLDFAGIDLLIPDIAVSWRDGGAAICEINAQPTLGVTTAPHLYAQLLKQLVPKGGRIPTVLLVGAAEPQIWIDAMSNAMTTAGLTVGSVGPAGVRVGTEPLTARPVPPFAGARMLAVDRAVEAMIVAVNDDSLRRTGLPLDRYDALLLAGTNISTEPDTQRSVQPRPPGLLGLVRMLLPACDGSVVIAEQVAAGGVDPTSLGLGEPGDVCVLSPTGGVAELAEVTIAEVLSRARGR